MYGARAGHVEAVRRLLAHGARPEATEGAGYTALHAAAANGRLEAAAALLDAGSDMAARGVDGMAPLVRVRVRARARVRVRLRARVKARVRPLLHLVRVRVRDRVRSRVRSRVLGQRGEARTWSRLRLRLGLGLG